MIRIAKRMILMLAMVTVTAATLTTATDKNWEKSDIGKLIPSKYLISLRIDTPELISDAIATFQQELGSSHFQSVKVFNHLSSSLSTVPSDRRDTNMPHILATLSPTGLEHLQAHPLVHLIEQDQVMGLSTEVLFNNGTCQQQASPPWGLSRINQR